MENATEMDILQELCREDPPGQIDYPAWIISGFSVVASLISGPLSLIFAVLSTVGNILSLQILCKLNIRRFYLSILAIANACISQCTLWYYALSETLKPFLGQIEFFQLLTVFLHPVSSFFWTLSIWMMLTVTADRYFALARPLQHRASESKLRAQRVTLTIALFAAIFSIPTAFELRLTYDCDAYQEVSRLRLLPTTLRYHLFKTLILFRLDENYLLIYQLLMQSIFVFVGPLVLLTLLTFRMIFIVYSAKKLRATTSQKSGNENTTRMLLTVVIKFLICNSPSIILNVWEKIVGPTLAMQLPEFRYCVEWSNLLVVINSSSDSIVYLRWWKQQKQSITYSPVRKCLFTTGEASYLKDKAQHTNLANIAEELAHALMPDHDELARVLETQRILGTIEDLLQSLGTSNAERSIILRLNEIGRAHKHLQIGTKHWTRFKLTFIKAITTNEDEALWTRFICLLIKEFKNGQACALNIQTDRGGYSKISQCSTFEGSTI